MRISSGQKPHFVPAVNNTLKTTQLNALKIPKHTEGFHEVRFALCKHGENDNTGHRENARNHPTAYTPRHKYAVNAKRSLHRQSNYHVFHD